MIIPAFELERYFAKHEFTARHLLSCSDCQTMPMKELVGMASENTRRLWEDLALGYTETLGHPLLRQAIADLHIGLGPENVLVVVPEEGIFLFMNALLQPGDHVVCVSPAYQSLHEIARALGCQVSPWVLDEAKDWSPSLDALEELLRPETRLVVINFPHNPTGSMPGPEFFKALYPLLEKNGVFLLSDEMYRFLDLDGGPAPAPACQEYSQAASLGGLSKAFGLPGLRLGWVATQDQDLLRRMSGLKDYTTICHSAPSEILGLMALENSDAVIAGQKRLIRDNLAVLDAFLDERRDFFQCVRPKGGSMCFPRLTGADSALAFCEKLVADTGVMLAPSPMFGFGDHHVRFGFGRRDFPQVLGLLSHYLDARPK